MFIEDDQQQPIIIGDAQVVFSPDQWRQGIAGRMKKALKKSVYSIRWKLLEQRFLEALEPRPPEAFWYASYAAFSLALPKCPSIAFDGYDLDHKSTDRWYRSLRGRMSRLVTEDLVGLDWRLRPQPHPQLCDRRPGTTRAQRQTDTAEHLARLEIERLLRRPDLQAYERVLIPAWLAEEGNLIDVASTLGWRYDVTRQRWSRLCKKLSAG
jgi:hypothetical protein